LQKRAAKGLAKLGRFGGHCSDWRHVGVVLRLNLLFIHTWIARDANSKNWLEGECNSSTLRHEQIAAAD
jgi:hypothetical protein